MTPVDDRRCHAVAEVGLLHVLFIPACFAIPGLFLSGLWLQSVPKGAERPTLFLGALVSYGFGLGHAGLWLWGPGWPIYGLFFAVLLGTTLLAQLLRFVSGRNVPLALVAVGWAWAPWMIGQTPCTLAGGEPTMVARGSGLWWQPSDGVSCQLRDTLPEAVRK